MPAIHTAPALTPALSRRERGWFSVKRSRCLRVDDGFASSTAGHPDQRRLVRVLTSTQTARTRMLPLTIICQ